MRNRILQNIEQAYLKQDVPQFEVGDTVDVSTKIVEGEKERIQVFSGTVIMKKGAGINQMFTVRRIVNNEGVERHLPDPFAVRRQCRRQAQRRSAGAPSCFICATAWASRFASARNANSVAKRGMKGTVDSAKPAENPTLATSAT